MMIWGFLRGRETAADFRRLWNILDTSQKQVVNPHEALAILIIEKF
jgi:hypothetical protein